MSHSFYFQMISTPSRSSRRPRGPALLLPGPGFIQFDIKSTQVSISADKKEIYVTVVINEGDRFTVSDIRLAGEPSVPAEKLFPLIQLRRGEYFSRKLTTESAERISNLLGDEGYAFANVNTVPEIDAGEQAGGGRPSSWTRASGSMSGASI